MITLVSSSCLKCGKVFFSAPYRHREYCSTQCSPQCYSKNNWKQKHPLEMLKRNSLLKKGKHYSTETEFKKGEHLGKNHPKWKGGKSFCKICGKKLSVYYSDLCIKHASPRKENHPSWKGGITPLANKIRNLPEYKNWIKEVFRNDQYTCQECNILGDGKNLEAHHKKLFSVILKEFLAKYSQFSPFDDKETLVRLSITHQPFWDINNGQTLCNNCHKNIKIKC